MKYSISLFAVALWLSPVAGYAQSADEKAIKVVLESHTQAAMAKNPEKAVSYFANSPNTAISYQEPGRGYIRGYQAVADVYRKQLNADSFKKSNDKLTTDDYRFRIVGNTAFVTYIETQTTPGGKATRTHKANYLEKEGDTGSTARWKMIGNFWMPEEKAPAPDQAMIGDWERAKAYTKEYLT